jgi:hypothetical protein
MKGWPQMIDPAQSLTEQRGTPFLGRLENDM